MHTGRHLLTTREKTRLEALFDDDEHAEVEVTWSAYQPMIAG